MQTICKVQQILKTSVELILDLKRSKDDLEAKLNYLANSNLASEKLDNPLAS